MNTNHTIQTNLSNPEELIEHLYGIIDTKIQYIDYQTEIVTSSFIDHNTICIDPANSTLGGGLRVIESIMRNNKRILDKISEFSATIKLLLLLRNHLGKVNAEIILELLTDNKFIQLTDKELIVVIKKNKSLKSNSFT